MKIVSGVQNYFLKWEVLDILALNPEDHPHW
jgi:hypothetical protein